MFSALINAAGAPIFAEIHLALRLFISRLRMLLRVFTAQLIRSVIGRAAQFTHAQHICASITLAVMELPLIIAPSTRKCCGKIRPVLPFIAPDRGFEIAISQCVDGLVRLLCVIVVWHDAPFPF